jgi:hypothetical protein
MWRVRCLRRAGPIVRRAVAAGALFVLIHELPENGGREVTAINFGATPVNEILAIPGVAPKSNVRDVLDPKSPPLRIHTTGQLPVSLAPYSGVALQITG